MYASVLSQIVLAFCHEGYSQRYKSPVTAVQRHEVLLYKRDQVDSPSLTERIRGQKRHVPAMGLATVPVTCCMGMRKYQAHSFTPASEGLQN